jgi:hypothetical protein
MRFNCVLNAQQEADLDMLQTFFMRSTRADTFALGTFVLKWLAGEMASGRAVGSLRGDDVFREIAIPHISSEESEKFNALVTSLQASSAIAYAKNIAPAVEAPTTNTATTAEPSNSSASTSAKQPTKN